MISYNCLPNSVIILNEFKLVPLRHEDRGIIMQMRNEQIYHLRQAELLTAEKQDAYFKQVVLKLYEQEKPNQILFSFLKEDELVGYGGLVHINWIDKHAEISFIMKTELQAENFKTFWLNYLQMIEQVAFKDLKFHKIFTYAFDVRPHLYPVLEQAGFNHEATLKEHCYFDEKFIDVLIHTKINTAV